MQPPLKSAVTKVLVIYMKSSVWVYFFLCFLVCLCVSLKGILCHICTLRRDEHLFVSRAQILECLCTGRCMSVCAANMFKLSSGHNWVCKVSHSSLLPTAEPCSRCELQWRPLIYKTFSAGAVCVGYQCDTKSKLVMGHYLLGCEEKLHMEPCQVQAPCAMPFYFTGGQPSEGNFSLRESVLHSSSPKPCHVLSIDPFCSFQKKTWLRGEVKEGNSLSVHGSSGQPSLVLLAWKMIPCQNTWPRRGVLTMLSSDTQLSQRNCDPWEGQEWALCLGEKQGLYMNSGMTKIQSEVTNASVHTQKKSMHCTFVSYRELVTQLQPPGPACSNTEIAQSHLQHPPSHRVHLFPFPSPILPCLHISVSKEITKGERPFFSASCWPLFSSPQGLKLIKWCHAWF